MDPLEDESKGKLHFPLRRFRLSTKTEVIRAKRAPTRITDAPAERVNRGVIEDVEEFRAEFRVDSRQAEACGLDRVLDKNCFYYGRVVIA
jgi:hypothetical protein